MEVHHHRGTRKKEMERISLSIPDVVPRCILRISCRVSVGAYNRTPAGKPKYTQASINKALPTQQPNFTDQLK